jgi:hypothetical protein
MNQLRFTEKTILSWKTCVWSFCHYLDNKICLNLIKIKQIYRNDHDDVICYCFFMFPWQNNIFFNPICVIEGNYYV